MSSFKVDPTNESLRTFILQYIQGPIYRKIPPSGGEGGQISADVIWGENIKMGREKVCENVKKEQRGR